MAEIIGFPGKTTLDIKPKKVLKAALKANMDQLVIAGIDENGEEYFASSYGSLSETLFLLERFKKMLLELKD